MVSAEVAALTGEVLKTMLLNKLKLATAMLLAVFVIAAGGTSLTYRAQFTGPADQKQDSQRTTEQPKPTEAHGEDQARLSPRLATESGDKPRAQVQNLHNKIVVHAKMKIDAADDAKELDSMIAVDPDSGPGRDPPPEGAGLRLTGRLEGHRGETAHRPLVRGPAPGVRSPGRRGRPDLVRRRFTSDHGLQQTRPRKEPAVQEHLLDGQRRLKPDAARHPRYGFGRRLVADGTAVVTVADRNRSGFGYQLYVMRPDGVGARRITDGGGLNVYAHFSPDGKQVAYYRHDNGDVNPRIEIVNVDGTNRRTLLSEKGPRGPRVCRVVPGSGNRLVVTTNLWRRGRTVAHCSTAATSRGRNSWSWTPMAGMSGRCLCKRRDGSAGRYGPDHACGTFAPRFRHMASQLSRWHGRENDLEVTAMSNDLRKGQATFVSPCSGQAAGIGTWFLLLGLCLFGPVQPRTSAMDGPVGETICGLVQQPDGSPGREGSVYLIRQGKALQLP